MTFALSAVSSFFADSLVALAPGIGQTGKRVALLVTLGTLAVANARGVRGVTRLNVVFTIAKLLPLLLLIVVGVFAMRGENLRVVTPPTGAAVARASLLLLFAFLGVESALVPSGEVKEPARTVPIAIFLAMGAVALFLWSLRDRVRPGILFALYLVFEGMLPFLSPEGWRRSMSMIGRSTIAGSIRGDRFIPASPSAHTRGAMLTAARGKVWEGSTWTTRRPTTGASS